MNQSNNQRDNIAFSLGFTDTRLGQAAAYPDLHPARISASHKGIYKAFTQTGELLAEPMGKLLHQAQDSTDLPAVGDFVLLDRPHDGAGNARIHQILPRTSLFTRKGPDGQAQVIAANIDTAFLCMSLNQDFNLRRLERYLSIAWNSGAMPVIVLTKSDLCSDLSGMLAQVSTVALGVEVLVVSSLLEEGHQALLPYLAQGQTGAFLGSSGVGKSTLINLLLGGGRMATNEIRQDGKGRHTTTHRELLPLPGSGSLIDTPGMRELGLDSADLDKGFADITTLAQHCRFGDCGHTVEPGCAVLAAVEEGALSAQRLESYHKLQRELGYEGLNARQREEKKIQSMIGGFGAMKEVRRHIKEKNKRRGG